MLPPKRANRPDATTRARTLRTDPPSGLAGRAGMRRHVGGAPSDCSYELPDFSRGPARKNATGIDVPRQDRRGGVKTEPPPATGGGSGRALGSSWFDQITVSWPFSA